jgi:hypothetical protein
LVHGHSDEGAFSGASLDRPALQKLLAEVRSGKIDIVVVYKLVIPLVPLWFVLTGGERYEIEFRNRKVRYFAGDWDAIPTVVPYSTS